MRCGGQSVGGLAPWQLGWMLLGWMLLGCGNGASSEPAPMPVVVAEVETQPSAIDDESVSVTPVEQRLAPVDVTSLIEAHAGRAPAGTRCEGAEVCLGYYDTAIWVSRRGWRNHFRMSTVHDGRSLPAEHLERALRHVLTEAEVATAEAHCELAPRLPDVFGLPADSFGVARVPPRSPGASIADSQPVAPHVANARLADAYHAIGFNHEHYALRNALATEHRVFTELELEAMQHDTFLDPEVRFEWAGLGERQFWFFAVSSPESHSVHTFVQEYAWGRTASAFEDYHRRLRDLALLGTLQAIEVAQVRFRLAALCSIPPELGGAEWHRVELSDRGWGSRWSQRP